MFGLLNLTQTTGQLVHSIVVHLRVWRMLWTETCIYQHWLRVRTSYFAAEQVRLLAIEWHRFRAFLSMFHFFGAPPPTHFPP